MGCDGRMLETIVTLVIVVQLEIAVPVLLIVTDGHRRGDFGIVTNVSGRSSHPTKIKPRRNSKTKFRGIPTKFKNDICSHGKVKKNNVSLIVFEQKSPNT